MARWLIDFDSTLANFEVPMLAALNREFGTNYQLGANTSWDWWFTDIPKAQSEFIWGDQGFKSREMTMAMPPNPGAIEGVNRLLDAGHELYVISDREDYMEEWLLAWTWKHGLSLPIIINDRHVYPKADVARAMNLTHVVEDAPHNALAMANYDCFEKIYLLDTPYNGHVQHDRITRIHHWDEIAA